MTMPDDAAHPERRRDTGLPTVPRVTSALARRVRYDKPRRFVVDGKELTEREAIEIDVETDKDFTLGGTGPALFVGEAVIVDSLRLDARRYRFFARPSDPIEAGALVALGRAGAGVPEPERRTRVRLEWRRGASE
ncbi:MAG: hypothetical protein C5B48_04625 [Candidatus Rokuibacteriota bacterium]|nr:MAG: hypothetical protein C5B48_04625 [Candidatus Rokubacteria bacterium]